MSRKKEDTAAAEAAKAAEAEVAVEETAAEDLETEGAEGNGDVVEELSADAVEEATEEPAEEPAEEPVVKSGGRTVRIRQFFGLYKNAKFIEDETGKYGVCDNISDEVLASLRADYPGAEIEVKG